MRSTHPPGRLACQAIVAFALIAAHAAPHVVAAQTNGATASPAQPLFSMGQPPVWRWYGGPMGVFGHPSQDASAGAFLGVHRPILNPVAGIVGLAGEAYAANYDQRLDGGARLLARTRAIGLGAGVDWEARSNDFDLILTFQAAVRRGGLLGRGTMLRIDYLPGRDQAVGVGLHIPLNDRFAGRTRSRDTDVDLPPAPSPLPASSLSLAGAVDAAIGAVSEAAELIRVYANLFSDENRVTLLNTARTYAETVDRARREAAGLRLPYGQTHEGVTRAYAEALARAFGLAAGDTSRGSAIGQRARSGLLDHVLIPYDSLFGQVKDGDGQAGIRSLTARAHARFVAWVRDSSGLSSGAHAAVADVHARWLRVVERVHGNLLRQWKDSRVVWLPLQLALTPDQYDEQLEVDSLVARAVGRPFTDRNALTYLRSSDLPVEIARSIYAARDYHVVWIHDFAGRRESGSIDDISFQMVADAYLPALTEAVRRYDQTGRFPAYLILIDQFFYASRDGRMWMSILEDPLGSDMDLGKKARPEQEAQLRARQAELRAAVAASARLRREAAQGGGEGWIRRVVKVHVNVIYPSDFSFRSHRIIPGIPFVPDNVIRDHRKIVFYDLNEAEPYRGALFVTGVGIGEHYASETWEDRGYRVRGPAALQVREAARQTLLANGFKPEQIPPPLRATASAEAAEARSNQRDYIGRALQVHNQVGFGSKQASVARAMLYNLAPPGSVIIVPDPLWLGAEWAAMLAGAAARGCRVVIIAPAFENAPSPQIPLMVVMHDVFSRLVALRNQLSAQLRAAGGELHVGMFAAKAPVNDVAGRRREIRAGLQRAPWIRQLVPFDAATLAVLERAATTAEADGRDATAVAKDEEPRPPQLHQKTQLVARPGAIATLVRQRGWEDVLARATSVQSRQTARFAEQLGWTTPDVQDDATQAADALLQAYEQSIPESERRNVSFYFLLGTQNHDPRGMMLDGEAAMVVSGFHAAAGLADLFFIVARSEWVTTQEELDRLLPPRRGFMRWVARLIRPAL